MENTNLHTLKDCKNSIGKYNTLPIIAEISKGESKKIRIPCSSEEVAKKVLYSYYHSQSKVSLVRN